MARHHLPVAPRLGSGVEAAPVAWSPETCVATVEAAQRILICADALIHSIHKQLHLKRISSIGLFTLS